MSTRKPHRAPPGVHTEGVALMVLGIELALRYARGDDLDIKTIRRDYRVSRATAYRWKRLLTEMGENFVVER
jgi:hypothetical protein